MNHARISSSKRHLVNANKTPYLRLPEARKGRDNSLLRPEDGYFELVNYKTSTE